MLPWADSRTMLANAVALSISAEMRLVLPQLKTKRVWRAEGMGR